MVDNIYHLLVYWKMKLLWLVDEGLGFGPPNQLGDFWKSIKIRAYFPTEDEDHMWTSWGEEGHHSWGSMVEEWEEICRCWESLVRENHVVL